MAGPWRKVAVGVAVMAVLGCDGGILKGSLDELEVEPGELSFAPTALQHARTLPVMLRNTGRSSIHVDLAESHVAGMQWQGFEPLKLVAGESRELPVAFTPLFEGEVSGLMTLRTDARSAGEGGLVEVRARGLGVRTYVDVAPERLDFGDVEIGTVRMGELLLTNPTQAEAPVRLAIEGADGPMFSAADAERLLVVAPGETRVVAVAFNPYRLAAAQATASVEICPGCEPVRVELAGFGISSVVDVRPLRIQFGRVAPGSRAEETVTVTNLGTEPLEFGGFEWKEPTQVFTFEPVTVDLIGPNQSVETRVTFAPVATGPVPSALLKVKVKAKNVAAEYVMVPVSGEAGASCLVVTPRTLDFGLVPEGMSSTRRVDLLNRCGEPVEVSQLALSTTQGGFFSLEQQPAAIALPTGGIGSVRITFTPKPASGTSAARLGFRVLQSTVSSSDLVELTGSTATFPPCQYSVVPSSLDFGVVNVGADVSLGVAVRNDGTEPCFVSSMRLASGSDPELTSEGAGPATLAAGEKATMMVRFQPREEGTYSALAEAFVNHPTDGRPTALVTGRAVQGCFQLQPPTLDFGTVSLACGGRTRAVTAYNGCAAYVSLQSALVGLGTSSEYSLVGGPSMPYQLPPGVPVQFLLRYAPVDDGEDSAAFRVEAGQGGLSTVGLRGKGVSKPTHTDRYYQEPQGKVDLLFVVDNSGSMMEEQQSLGQNFAAIMAAAQAAGIDYHIGVTTTGLEPSPGGWSVCPGGAEGGENGRLFPVNGASPRIITPATPNAAQVFATNVQVGWCHWNEQGLEAAYRALSSPLVGGPDDPRTAQGEDGNGGFLRPDAKLAIIVVSDEEDFSPQPVAFYTSYFRSLKGNDPSLLSFSAIVAPAQLSTCPTASSSGARYMELAQETGGIVESICTQNWAASLTNLSANAFGPKRRFPLSETPLDPARIEVVVDGRLVTTGWTYDATTNSVVFDPASVPAPGSVVELTYPLGC